MAKSFGIRSVMTLVGALAIAVCFSVSTASAGNNHDPGGTAFMAPTVYVISLDSYAQPAMFLTEPSAITHRAVQHAVASADVFARERQRDAARQRQTSNGGPSLPRALAWSKGPYLRC